MKEVCVHGHFYQPSRVDPWTGELRPQPSAAPFRDWNERIAAECYAPSLSARILDPQGRTRRLVNTCAWGSFDFGPTLLAWLEEHRPVVLEGIRRADRDSRARFGHGSALAQPYHHPILPLCDPVDRRTEIAWGLSCFERIFERPAEGMWLPETAVDGPTLEAIADAGLRFVILAPHQVEAIADSEDGAWAPVGELESANRAYRIPLPSGRELTAVVYDGGVSRAVAFEGLLHDGGQFADRLAQAASTSGFALVATDGESYGHHHPFGEMALAWALDQLEARDDVRVTNIPSWLERNPPTQLARLRDPSSWSCSHGLGRWSANCGCRVDSERGWHQRWRAPLRQALEQLRDRAREALAGPGKSLFAAPAAARDAFGEVLGRPESFASWYATRAGGEADPERARSWLEIQRHLLAMFTSCAWFFDEVTGLEPLQNLRHAACAVARLRDLTGVDLAPSFEAELDAIPGNLGTQRLLETVREVLAGRGVSSPRVAGLSPSDRSAGVLLPVSALGGAGPIGDLDAAIDFIDWLAEAGVGLWQVLPLVPTDSHGSPYSSGSALSGNPDLVGLQGCIEAGLLDPSSSLPRTERVDYEATARAKRPLVLQAARALLQRPDHPWSIDLRRFARQAHWATEAATFHAIKWALDGAPWWAWPEPLARGDAEAVAQAREELADQIRTWRAALFLFERQWARVRSHAAARGVRLVGDMPIYVGRDSVDVWLHQALFQLDDAGEPLAVAGVPPDAYSETGQLWGNPLFDWGAVAADGWRWWIARCRRMLEHCDALRIDHFIGFDRYWRVDAAAEDARGGAWVEGPGRALFDALRAELGPLPLVAEDLGALAESTERLRDELELPGMRVLPFGLDGDPSNPHHPSQHPVRSVVYSSTHDSSTARGAWEALGEHERARLGVGWDGASAARGLVDRALDSRSFWAVLPLQDVLSLGDEARMNVPGTTEGNWRWRAPDRWLDGGLAEDLRRRIRRAGRLGPQAHRSDTAPTAAAGARAGFVGPRVAYFCMEYGISHELPIYSGGLGVLAGDIVKAAADQHRDFVAIGVLWGEGYFVQDIDEEGRQVPRYVETPRERLRPTGVEVEIRVAGETVPITAWRVLQMGSVELLLLEPVREEQRWITQRLYGGTERDRVVQELLLGVGGVRVLRALGLPVDVYHFNEGHALFAGFELVREHMARGMDFEEAVESVRGVTVFTTHTPVPAGNEVHPLDRLLEVGLGLDTFSREQLAWLGGDDFEMTPAGLRLARKANAVAELHGRTARSMWAHVERAAPIVAITNGVHMPTWQDPLLAGHARRGATEELWERHQELKRGLIHCIAERSGSRFREDALLVGFARRAATYKRAALLLQDRDWLEALFAAGRLQLVFAGKAHPKDAGGAALVQELVLASRRWPEHLVFLPNYDMQLGALLTRGCDIWLNNPVRPKEASGTSGMKAAANGVLNLSVLDGWWDEGCVHGVNGWGVGAPPEGQDADGHDASALRCLLQDEVLPAYERDRARWLQMMRASIADAGERFSAGRCVRRYYEELYGPESA